MQIDEGLDTGPVYAREERAIQCEIDKKEQSGRGPKKSGAITQKELVPT